MTAQKCTSPVGELEWVTITGEGKENLQGDMQYVASVVLPEELAKPFRDEIDQFWEANKPKGITECKSTGYYDHMEKS